MSKYCYLCGKCFGSCGVRENAMYAVTYCSYDCKNKHEEKLAKMYGKKEKMTMTQFIANNSVK